MGIFGRWLKVGEAKVNEGTDKVEKANMGAMAKQAIRDLEEAQKETTGALAQLMGQLNMQKKKLETEKTASKQCLKNAKVFADKVKAGQMNEADAKQHAGTYLDQKKQHDALVAQMSPLFTNLQVRVDEMRAKLDKFKTNIASARAKEQLIQTKEQFAKGSKKMAEARNLDDGSSAFAMLERMDAAADEELAFADALDEVGGSSTSAIDEAAAALSAVDTDNELDNLFK